MEWLFGFLLGWNLSKDKQVDKKSDKKSVFYKDEMDINISKIDLDKLIKEINPTGIKFGCKLIFGTSGPKIDNNDK